MFTGQNFDMDDEVFILTYIIFDVTSFQPVARQVAEEGFC